MILDAYGRPVRTQELTREHAAPSLTGVRTIWTDTIAAGLTPQRLANLLRSAQEGDHTAYLTLAEEMEERDLHYACELGKRKLAVSRLPAVVEAASDTPRDIELADAIRNLVRRPGFRGLVKDLLDALGKGYSVVEIDWLKGARWLPGKYDWRDPRFFQTDRTAGREIRLRDEADLVNGLPLAPYKFISHVPKLKSGIPIRGGLARLAAWAWMCKGYTVKDWLAFAEVFGMPLRLGKYKPGATDADINILKTAVANLGSDAAAVFPESMMIELVETAKAAGSQEFFKVLADWLDAQISKGILGQTASASGTPGKLGDDKLQAEVRADIRDDDAEQIEETLNRDLVRPYIDLNYGPQENYPELQLRAAKNEDIAALSDSLAKLVPLGLRVEQSVIRDRIGIPDPDKNAKPEDLLGGQPQAVPTKPALNREHGPGCPHCQSASNAEDVNQPDAADRIAANASAAAAPHLDAMIHQVKAMLSSAASLQEARAQLLELYDQMDPADLGAVMMQAMTTANLAGRAEVADGD